MAKQKKMKLALRSCWEDGGDRFFEIRIGKAWACCVKKRPTGLSYVLQCEDGNDIYSDIAGADFPLRKMSKDEEKEVLAFAEQYYQTQV